MKCWCGGDAEQSTIVGLDGQLPAAVCLDSEYHDPAATGRREKHTRLYIAGPMSGYAENNYPAFHEAARHLRGAGYEVVSPAEFGGADLGQRVHYVDLIREDLRHMLDCHGVATIDNWWESVGARNEINVAGILRMPVLTVPEWLARAALELS